MKPFRFHREADTEFTNALDHYAALGADLGGRFYDELEQVIAEAVTPFGCSAAAQENAVAFTQTPQLTPFGGFVRLHHRRFEEDPRQMPPPRTRELKTAAPAAHSPHVTHT